MWMNEAVHVACESPVVAHRLAHRPSLSRSKVLMTDIDTGASDDATTDELPVDETAENVASEEEKQPLSLEISVEEPSACERHITVTVSRDDIERYFSDQFDEIMPKAEVPGFRPGHAPRKLVEKRFRDQIEDQVKGSLLMDSMTQVNEQLELSAISEPDFDFDAVQVPDEGPMTFEFKLEVRPDFELPQWQGLEIEKPVHEYTDADVDEQMKILLSQFGDLVPSDEAVAAGDHVVVNLKVRHDGKQIAQADELTLRVRPKLSFPDATLEGFDKLMIGAKADDKRQASVTVSASAENPDLRGEEIGIEFEILDVKKLELPQVDEKLLAKIGNFESEQQLREAVLGELNRQLQYHQNRRVREQITASLTESADWELPKELLERQSHREFERAIMELQSSGFSREDIRAHENELRQNSEATTAQALKEHFILERIAEEEGIEDTPEDYDREIMMIALSQQDTPRRVRARLEKRGQMDTLRNQIIERKVVDLITSKAKFKEVEFNPQRQETEAVELAVGGRQESSEIPSAKPGGQSESLNQPVDHS